MPDIRIGREYEQAFRSICKLVEGKCIDKKIVLSASLKDNEIVEQNNNRFIFDPNIQNIENGADEGMLNDGASWFKAFRNGEVDEGNASWLNLIEEVANNYHQKFSFVEFQQKEEDIDEETITTQKNIISQFISMFFYNLSSCQIIQDDKVKRDNIYGVSLKIEIDGGTGEAEPVLCKIYFRQTNDKFIPIITEDALILESQLYQIINSDEEAESTSSEENQSDNGTTIDLVLNALESLIESEKFCDSVILSSEEDKMIVQKLIDRSADDITQLKCRSVNVFGISHVEWKNASYYLKDGSRNVLRFAFGMNNKFYVYCVNCGDELLVDNNRFIMKEGFKDIKKLDSLDPHFGYNGQLIQDAKNNSLISLHLFPIKCNRNGRECSKMRCMSQIIAFSESEIDRKCIDCPYPEIITYDEKNRLTLTSKLTFVNDLMQLVSDEVDTRECVYCLRRFTRDVMVAGSCPLCSQTDTELSGERKVEAINLYKNYRGMLPVSSRLLRIFKEKYCFEDDGIIIFKLGNSRFLFNKMDIKFNGIMSGPKKLK